MHSSMDEIMEACQRGMVDYTFLGGAQIDMYGNINTSMIDTDVIVKESETGLGAFELLVDPASQVAYPEYGPNMMWNLKYGGLNHGGMMGGQGMMGGNGMMGGSNYQNQTPNDITTEMAITSEQAIQYAQQYLDSNYAGATAVTDPIQFYGYYTLDFEKDGKIIGMLSANSYSGQIFLHTWHGTFIEEAE